ncbi:MAG: DUF349 domain-containing protein [Cytophagales bacterium]|nr:DUF349 domain-containing protein [Cytophagales bacterium]MDW8385287.1 DUF349 domain-containing protein [Flammeovirgaceae bacterium]
MENTNLENALQADTLQNVNVSEPSHQESYNETTSSENAAKREELVSAEELSTTGVSLQNVDSSTSTVEKASSYASSFSDSEEDEDDEEAEAEDFANRSLEDLVKSARELAKSEDWRKTNLVFQALRHEVERLLKEETEAAKAQFLKEGGAEEDFRYKRPELYDKFYEYYEEFKNRRATHFENVKKERENNLKRKKALIEELRNLIEHNEERGVVNRVREITKEWREIGQVPKADAENIYQTYQALLNRFYDKKSIESDLKELDRQKNYKAKLEIVEKAEKLLQLDSLSEAVRQLDKLHEEFKSIGPVMPEEREAIWLRFKAASDKIYEEKRRRAEEYRNKLNLNMKLKQELCLKIEEYINFESDKIKDWIEKTKEVVALQEEWQKIGPIPHEVRDINRQFWSNYKLFFQRKNQFMESIEKERNENLAKKIALCEQAEAMQNSTDWKETTEKFMKLQQEWKNIGPVPDKYRESIFERFKKACDTFFERKRNCKDLQEQEYENNLNKKTEICQKINSLAQKGVFDKEEITSLVNEYFAIGFVSSKHKYSIVEKFAQALDHYFDKVKSADEQEKEKCRIELTSLLYERYPFIGEKLHKKEAQLRRKIEALESDIALWENNIAFFSKSKTADKLREEFKAKIENAQKKVSELKIQQQFLRNLLKTINVDKGSSKNRKA